MGWGGEGAPLDRRPGATCHRCALPPRPSAPTRGLPRSGWCAGSETPGRATETSSPPGQSPRSARRRGVQGTGGWDPRRRQAAPRGARPAPPRPARHRPHPDFSVRLRQDGQLGAGGIGPSRRFLWLCLYCSSCGCGGCGLRGCWCGGCRRSGCGLSSCGCGGCGRLCLPALLPAPLPAPAPRQCRSSAPPGPPGT